MTTVLSFALANWQYPAGMITDETVAEVREKIETQAWVERLHDARVERLQTWGLNRGQCPARVRTADRPWAHSIK